MAQFDDIIHLKVINAIEEAEVLIDRPNRIFHPFNNPFEEYSDRQFVKLYRLTKPVALDLINMLEPHLIAPTRISALSIPRKVLLALRFFASGSYQWDIAKQMNHAVVQSSVSQVLHEVIEAMNSPEIFNTLVYLPRNMGELRLTRTQFFRRYHFPGVIGCVDCTHVAIYPPKNNPMYREEIYVNRKGYHSINAQLICDSNLKILNVCARYPGSTHDSYIWNNSNAFRYIRNIHNNGHQSFAFLGDSGYALRPWMLTPKQNANLGSPEEQYNIAQMQTRSLIERCNGVLKLRFRCLLKHRVLHYDPTTASKIINSCVLLHNLCINSNIPAVRHGDDEEDNNINIDYGMYDNLDNNQENEGNDNLIAGRRMQQIIIRNHFGMN